MHSTRSDIEPIDPSVVPFIISAIDTWTYAEVAGLTLLVYDTIITMDKEGSPCKSVSSIYFAVNTFTTSYKENRYVGILGAISGIVVDTFQANETLHVISITAKNDRG
ncbi:hypothetical protein DFH11DRAFT_1548312 [Phellopilus nigrolimitatus]|nr:hypothetical protein DFH11DRAFT_1548312 [Phellopilus nigrolimitatus]